MKNTFKKIGVIVLTLAMIFAMSAVAFADDDNVWNGTDDGTGLATTNIAGTNTIPLNKTLVIFNTTDSTTVREPDITFSYTVKKAFGAFDNGSIIPGTTITDSSNNTVTVYNGVNAAITAVGTIAYSNANTVTATTKGFEDEKSTNITVDPTAFPHAGVYRYVITESSNPADVTARGLEAHTTDYDSTRYLDIYIYNPDTTHTTLWMGAAVIFKTVATTAGEEGKDDIDTTFEKTTGFEPGTDGTPGTTDFTNDATVDRYFTYNLTVTKKITGTLADTGHAFPFQIAITGALAHAVTVDVDNNGSTSTASVSTTVLNQTANLADGQSYIVKGLPKGTTATVTEYNNTADTYKLTTSFAGTSSSATQSNADEGTTQATATGESDVLINSGDASAVKADTDTVLTFTNNLETISPTGVVMRVAPYAAIGAAGFLFLALAKKSKKEEEEEA